MIPRIIWQTDEKPYDELEPFKKNIIETWKNLNPGWKHIYVDSQERESYVKKHNSTLYDVYKISNGMTQADIWRMLVIYRNGGVYADMDSVAIAPLDESITKSYKGEEIICTSKGFQTGPEMLNISNFCAIKNSKIMKFILSEIILECKSMIEFKKPEYNNPGWPALNCFSRVALKNTDDLCFMDNYFSHSDVLKLDFDLNYEVSVNAQVYTYLNLAKINNWLVY